MLHFAKQTLPFAMGAVAAYCSDRDLREILTNRRIKKAMAVACPIQDAWRSQKFRAFLNFLLKRLKLRTGMNCRRLRGTVRPVFKAIDSCIQRAAQTRNPLCTIDATEEVSDGINALLSMCDIRRPMAWETIFSSTKLDNAVKINEGSYGEIYLTRDYFGLETVLKVVPVYGRHKYAGSLGVHVQDVVTDVACSRALSDLGRSGSLHFAANFPRIFSVSMNNGKTPQALVKSWQRYFDEDNDKFKSRPRPDRYSEDTMFITLEIGYCGESFSETELPGFEATLSYVFQVVAALAVAEDACSFEHRDLHLGNLLLRSTPQEFLQYSCSRWSFRIRTHFIQAYIIDFTMSRLDYGGQTHYFDITPLVTDEGGPPVDPTNYADHNNIYAMMGEICKSPENGDLDWTAFEPRTNVFWIRHVLENVSQRLLQAIYQAGLYPAQVPVFDTIEQLRQAVLHSGSAMEFFEEQVAGMHDLIFDYART